MATSLSTAQIDTYLIVPDSTPITATRVGRWSTPSREQAHPSPVFSLGGRRSYGPTIAADDGASIQPKRRGSHGSGPSSSRRSSTNACLGVRIAAPQVRQFPNNCIEVETASLALCWQGGGAEHARTRDRSMV